MSGPFDFLFGQTNQAPTTIDTRTPQQQQMDSFMSNFVNQYGSQYQPGKQYSGSFTAPLSGLENQGLNQFLPQYLNGPNVTPGMSNIQNFLQNTINGGYDPNTSPQYAAYRDQANYNNTQAIKNTQADLGAAGKFFSSEAATKYGDINAQTAMGLNTENANLANNERNRQMSAVGPASQIEQFIQNMPLNKASAALQYGALPRQIEQSDLESQYQDFLRQQKELGGVTGVAQAGAGGPGLQAYYPKQTPSLFTQLAPMLGSMATSQSGQGAMSSIGQFLGSMGGMFGGGAAAGAAGAGAAGMSGAAGTDLMTTLLSSGADSSIADLLPMLMAF